jgi:tetraacyldisaccharide 4'-kinase
MRMRSKLAKAIPGLWYSDSSLALALLPFAWIYALVAGLRRFAYTSGLLSQPSLPVPVIVVGNISIGGTGKTPIVSWLARCLKAAGHRPGIVSRGYGSSTGADPQLVKPGADPQRYGDEAVLLAELTDCPVVVCSDRVKAVQLVAGQGVTVVISDDGLQHYRMQRIFELVVVDGERNFGNGHLLPAGPLREPVNRLATVDAVVINGGGTDLGQPHFQLEPGAAVNLGDGSQRSLDSFAGERVWAVAGIGNPERFNKQLTNFGITADSAFVPDHGRISLDKLRQERAQPILMTSKDAVKYRDNAPGDCWLIPVVASFTSTDEQALMKKIGTAIANASATVRENA